MSVDDTLAERGSRYGDFTDHAGISQALQDVMRTPFNDDSRGWPALNVVQKQALTVIADKIARILSGDPNYADNWHDIQGYAKLVEDRLPKPVWRGEVEDDRLTGWHQWDCHHIHASAGPYVPPGYRIVEVRYPSGEVDELLGRTFLWDDEPFPEQRIVAYRVERA